MPPLRSNHPSGWLALMIALAAMATVFAPSPVDAHGNDSGAAGRASATRFHVLITAFDTKQDGHCAVGRVHEGGRWRVRATDCSHRPIGNGVGSNPISASGRVSASACLRGHGYNSNTCHYGQLDVPFGRVTLGNAP